MLEYKGLPVPWVALWSHEVVDPADHRLGFDDQGRVRYLDERPHDRDALGVPWVRTGIARGKGTPMFGQIHALRQRASMTRPRCQVCGTVMDGHTFLLDSKMIGPRTDEWFTTATPPTCLDCRALAVELCPHLRAQAARGELIWVTPTAVGVWGYLGDLALPDGSWHKQRWVHVKDSKVRTLLAKQVVLGVSEWREEPWGATSTTTVSTPS